MRKLIVVTILAAGLIAAQDSSAQQVSSQPPPQQPAPQTPAPQEPTPVPEQPGRFSRFFRAISPDSLDIGITKCTGGGCKSSSVNGGALMGTAWELPAPASFRDKVSAAVGLALISEEPGETAGSSSANKESNLHGGVTLGVQYRLIKLIALKGGVAYGSRTWGFVVFSLNYKAEDKPAPVANK